MIVGFSSFGGGVVPISCESSCSAIVCISYILEFTDLVAKDSEEEVIISALNSDVLVAV